MPSVSKRLATDLLFKGVLGLATVILFIPLIMILYYIIVNGAGAISWAFLTSLPKPPGEIGSGIGNAIVGSAILICIACTISVPIGVGVGVFLSEKPTHTIAKMVRICLEILQGIPSIVIGIISYLWVVLPMGGFSALSGGIALSLMMLPLVIRSTEETLKLIPQSLKEASLGLGVPYYRTMTKIIIPAGRPGISTGIILGISRVAGETAPLLFTAFGNPFLTFNIMKPVNSLPSLIYNYATSPYSDWQQAAWGASLVLILFLFTLSLIARTISTR
ncbi:phosphate ABC transporter permease PstA [bacterium]|nr:phosphate ABC transporter permease PstA [bacterium]